LAQTLVVRKPSQALLSLALLGGVALSTGGAANPSPAHAEDPTQTWLTLDRPWLCRIWTTPSRFIRHCTTRWYLDNSGNLVSGDPSWVPVDPIGDLSDVALAWPHDYRPPVRAKPTPRPPAVKVRKAAHTVQTAYSAHSTIVVSTWSSYGDTGPFGLWTPPPGHPAYALPDYAGDPNARYYGYCTWYAQYRRPSERLIALGNAWQWTYNAPSHGLRVGYSPAVGATVVFQPGVFGAGSGGHVGHVEAVYTGGWFMISEMNMAWNGGGWGRVSFRYVHVAPGVSFIY
jgi:surface antigen